MRLHLTPRVCGCLCAADDVEEIQAAVKSAIQQCGVQLKQKIVRAQAAREQRQRKKNLTKYIPNVAAAVHTVLLSMAAAPDGAYAVKRRRLDALHGLVPSVGRGEVTEQVLAQRLTEHVERIDMDMVRRRLHRGIMIITATCMSRDGQMTPVPGAHAECSDFGSLLLCGCAGA